MPDVRMPDGTVIRNVPEGTTRAQLQTRIDRAQASKKLESTYQGSGVSQGLSGINEGIASSLGAPVDIVNSLLGLGARGANALAGTDLKVSDKPFLGSESIKGMIAPTIAPRTVNPAKNFIRRVGQSVGAAAVPVAGTASGPTQIARALIPAATGGAGAAAAQQIAPNNPWAEMGAETLGALIGGGGVYRSAKKSAQRAVESRVPTTQELKSQASNLYDAAEAGGVVADQRQTKALAAQFRQIASREGLRSPTGRISTAYPKAKEALDLTNDFSRGQMTPTQMQTVRKVLSEAAASPDNSERRIARQMLQTFDDWTTPLAPELAQARKVASRYLSAGKLEQARDLAGARAGQFTGSGFENALRTEYRGLDRKIIKGQERGFNPQTIEAINKVSRGTRASNAARTAGKLAPTGVVSAGIGTGVPFAIGTSIGGPALGGTLAAGSNAVGIAGRKLATDMGLRNATLAELMARNGGALPTPSVLTPEGRRIMAALAAGQSSQYAGKQKVKKK